MKTMKIAALAAIGVMLSTPIAAQASYTIVARVMSVSGTVKGGAINCTNNAGTCIGSFSASQTFQAVAASGYALDKWTGCTVDSVDPTKCTPTMSSQVIYAYFKLAATPPPPPPTLIVRISGGSGGVTQYFQTPSPNPISCHNNMGVCSLTPFTSKIILSAEPDAGYVVDKWVGCSPSADLTICDAGSGTNKTVSIYFKEAPPPVTHTLTLLVQGGSGAVSVGDVSCFSADGGVTYTGTCTFEAPHASTLKLTASPTLGYVFDHWAGCILDPEPNPNHSCTLMLTDNWPVGATFKLAPPPAPTPSGSPDDSNGSLPP